MVARLPQRLELRELRVRRRLVDVEDLDRRLVLLHEVVDADDDLFLALDGLLEAVRALGDLPLRKAALDRLDHAAHAVDRVEVRERAVLHVLRQLLDEIRPAQRIDDVRDAAFVRDDLLRPERERRGFGGRQRERLVERVGVQRVGAAEHGRQRLQRGAHDVVVRLLRGERHAGGLAVEPQLPRALVLRAEAVAHGLGPDLPRGAILGDLLEEVAVRVEEERHARHEVVDVEAGVDAPLHVLDAVAQRERQLLQRRRARFADVIAAHRDRVPLGTCAEQNAKMSVMIRIEGRGGKMYSFCAMNSLRMSF